MTEEISNSRARNEFYKTSLNILRTRRLNMEVSEMTSQAPTTPPATPDRVMEMVNNVHTVVTYQMATTRASRAVAFNVGAMSQNRSNYEKVLKDIARVSLAIQNLRYNSPESNEELVKADIEEADKRGELFARLERVVEEERESLKLTQWHSDTDTDTKRRLEKAVKTLRKINDARVVLDAFISHFCADHNRYPHINQMRSSLQRKLLLHDFINGYYVGLEPKLDNSQSINLGIEDQEDED